MHGRTPRPEGEKPAAPERPGAEPPRFAPGLSGRLLLLTIGFVMLAEVLIFVPSIANFRLNWLSDRIASAQTAALALEAAPAGMVPPGLERRLLTQVGAATVAVRSGGARRLLAISDMPPMVVDEIDLRDAGPLELAAGAYRTLAATEPRFIRVVGAGMDKAEFVEIVMDETALRQAMLAYSVNILGLSLLISLITALLVYGALHKLIVRPVRRLTSAITAFEDNPDDPGRVIKPGGRRDEIGLAEQALARMQASLAGELREKKHLAALGLAVSKINHDLRNMLTSAQLFSDRIAATADPAARRFGPKLIGALDRAIGFASATLAYGRAVEPPPRRRQVALRPLLEEVGELLGLGPDTVPRFVTDAPAALTVEADPDQLSRALVNLGRNAAQALADSPPGPKLAEIVMSARRADARIVIRVADTGPGVPARMRETLFQAFQGSTTPGGSGLGLAIAAELIEAHGGTIALLDEPGGAIFEIMLPDSAGR